MKTDYRNVLGQLAAFVAAAEWPRTTDHPEGTRSMKPPLAIGIALLALATLAPLAPAARAQGGDIQPDLRIFREALLRHRPVYRFDSDEDYFPLRVNAVTNNPDNRLERENDDLIVERREDGSGLNIRYLRGSRYPNGDEVRDDDRINLRGNDDEEYLRDARRLQANLSLFNRVYARVVPILNDTGRVAVGAWLQYWVFYYYNSFEKQGIGKHEADWEMIQIRVNDEARPIFANYAQHEDGSECAWADMERVGRRRQRPVVYVGGGSHASYFTPGGHDTAGIGGDRADGNGWHDRTVKLRTIESTIPMWLNWPGYYGASLGAVDSPRGPAFQSDKFWHPAEFARATREHDRCR
jgi:hypothetical protein